MRKGYKFKLELTHEQAVLINKTLGCCRWVYNNALYYKTETSSNFRDFLKKHNAIIEPVAPQSFKESGTTIDVVIVKIVKE